MVYAFIVFAAIAVIALASSLINRKAIKNLEKENSELFFTMTTGVEFSE